MSTTQEVRSSSLEKAIESQQPLPSPDRRNVTFFEVAEAGKVPDDLWSLHKVLNASFLKHPRSGA